MAYFSSATTSAASLAANVATYHPSSVTTEKAEEANTGGSVGNPEGSVVIVLTSVGMVRVLLVSSTITVRIFPVRSGTNVWAASSPPPVTYLHVGLLMSPSSQWASSSPAGVVCAIAADALRSTTGAAETNTSKIITAKDVVIVFLIIFPSFLLRCVLAGISVSGRR